MPARAPLGAGCNPTHQWARVVEIYSLPFSRIVAWGIPKPARNGCMSHAAAIQMEFGYMSGYNNEASAVNNSAQKGRSRIIGPG